MIDSRRPVDARGRPRHPEALDCSPMRTHAPPALQWGVCPDVRSTEALPRHTSSSYRPWRLGREPLARIRAGQGNTPRGAGFLANANARPASCAIAMIHISVTSGVVHYYTNEMFCVGIYALSYQYGTIDMPDAEIRVVKLLYIKQVCGR